jgi:hypothetical protein
MIAIRDIVRMSLAYIGITLVTYMRATLVGGEMLSTAACIAFGMGYAILAAIRENNNV